jgi:uncharacterized protein (DUF433 family)
MMKLEDYFDELAPDDIRIKGHRIGIESILYDYLAKSKPPEQIAETYPSLSLEQVYATILYYLHDKERGGAYLEAWLEHGRRMRAEQDRNPLPVVARLRQLKAERRRASGNSLSPAGEGIRGRG